MRTPGTVAISRIPPAPTRWTDWYRPSVAFDNDCPCANVDQPVLSDPMAGVEWALDVAVSPQRRFRNLNQEQNVGRFRQLRCVVVRTCLQHRDVGIGDASLPALWTETVARSPRAALSNLSVLSVMAKCCEPIGAMDTTTPSMNSTRSSGDTMPASAMRWCCSTVKGCSSSKGKPSMTAASPSAVRHPVASVLSDAAHRRPLGALKTTGVALAIPSPGPSRRGAGHREPPRIPQDGQPAALRARCSVNGTASVRHLFADRPTTI